MERRWEVIGFLVLVCCISQGLSLICFVCFPDMKGDMLSRYEAVDIRANISRTYEDRAYNHFGLCSNLSMDNLYQVVCPSDSTYTVCMTISNDYWMASTCGLYAMPAGATRVCKRKGHLETCYCNTELCNSSTHQVARSPYLLLLVSLLLAWKVK
ncbi:uncharacterized protein LOC143033001 [Oratosquilla oratoria]|uniref:uncharacterized protein LOC143033001 n=1 Tax=Oratosquilla oratoria TaxID=337810 RepID=UPI003F769A66